MGMGEFCPPCNILRGDYDREGLCPYPNSALQKCQFQFQFRSLEKFQFQFQFDPFGSIPIQFQLRIELTPALEIRQLELSVTFAISVRVKVSEKCIYRKKTVEDDKGL